MEAYQRSSGRVHANAKMGQPKSLPLKNPAAGDGSPDGLIDEQFSKH